MKKVFAIPSKPVGKQRPRKGKHGFYTPSKTVEFEELTKLRYLEEYDIDLYEYAIRIKITVITRPPDSYSINKKKKMLDQPNLTKPDLDNIAKSILDSLNKVAYKDDNQVYDLHITKKYGGVDNIVVEIYYEL